jgi:hypothetical protein
MSLKDHLKEAKIQFEQTIFTALDAFREEITERRLGYLERIYTELQNQGINIKYVSLSLLISKYRTAHDIPFVNRREDRRRRRNIEEHVD